MKLMILGLFVLVTVLACSPTKDISNLKEKDIVIILKKGSCYGKCAVYNLHIYKDGFVTYEGILHSEKIGFFSKRVTKEELNTFKKEFEDIGFMELPSEYPSEIVDLPLITMMYRNGKKSKIVSGRTDRPKNLLQLQYKLEKLANSTGWKLEKANDNPTNTSTNEHETKALENQLILAPAENVSLTNWFQRYQRYDLQLIKKLAPSLNFWLVSFNTKLISQEEMIKLLKGDKDIKSVEVNRVLEERDR
jgi:Domain of unknown function (DUF6438)